MKANESSSSNIVTKKPEKGRMKGTSVRLTWFRPYVLSSDSNDSNTMVGVLAIAVNVFLAEDV